MAATKDRKASRIGREVTDEDRARWIEVSETIRRDPRFLKYVRGREPSLYAKVISALRSLAIEATDVKWRDPRPGFGGRPDQLIPGTPGSFSDRNDWLVWLLMGGRGSGKSRTGAEAIRELIFGRTWIENPRVALVGQTLESVRIDMVERTLIPLLPPGSVLQWNRGTCELWIDIGRGKVAYLKGYSSDAARKLRGPNFHLAWADEIATFSDANRAPGADSTTWSNMKMAVRMDDQGTWKPRIIATTTPKAVPLIRNPDESSEIDPGPGVHDDPSTVVSNMTTLENQANLSSHFFKTVIEPLEGTRIYDQEVLGILMDAALGALWTSEQTDAMTRPATFPERQAGGLGRVVVAIDPSVGAGLGDECGIVVSGVALDGRCYILEDCSVRGDAAKWSKVASDAFHRWGAETVVAEVNQGGELVEQVLGRYDSTIPVEQVWAKEGKLLRAEPVALMSDSDLLRFAGDNPAQFSRLKFQMHTWEGDGDSPDRLDAMVYSVLYLMPKHFGASNVFSIVRSGTRRRRRG